MNISIVVTSRNDDHDGSLIHRMKLFLSSLSEQITKRKVSAEIVIVEWNPPSDRPSLKKELSVSGIVSRNLVRIITVPHEVHTSYPHSEKLHLYQFIAKNVGIRRAQGKYILATNIDILFADETLDVFETGAIGDKEMVRAIRFDVPDRIQEQWSSRKILQWCGKHTIKGYYPLKSQPSGNAVKRILGRIGFSRSIPPLFTNACGDFTLLSRDYWDRLRGYPELPLHGVKIDGLLCFNAYFAGAKERILSENACVYHIDHENSWSDEKGKNLQDRLTGLGIPFLSREEYVKTVEHMVRKNGPLVFNGQNWGLADRKFQECTI